jgi:hypothetical protein
VVSENPQAIRLRQAIRQVADPDLTRDTRIRLGQMLYNAISAKRQADMRTLGAALAGHVVASTTREPTHEMDAANLAVLAELAHQEDLENAVSAFARGQEGRITVRLLGPMAPYDFVPQAPGTLQPPSCHVTHPPSPPEQRICHPAFWIGSGQVILNPISARTPALMCYRPVSGQGGNPGRSCTVTRNPEKPYVPGGGVARARKSGLVRRGAGLGLLPLGGAAGGFR